MRFATSTYDFAEKRDRPAPRDRFPAHADQSAFGLDPAPEMQTKLVPLPSGYVTTLRAVAALAGTCQHSASARVRTPFRASQYRDESGLETSPLSGERH